jgi:electron transfer flavoprotein alpha subunit
MAILVYIENTDGTLKKSAFEAASYAKAIADQLGDSVTALSIGNVDKSELEKLGKYGVSKVLDANQDKLQSFVNKAYASIIASAAKQEGSKVVVLSNSFSGKGLGPRVAAKLDAGFADGAINLPTFNGDSMEIKKTAFSNKAFATEVINSAVKVIAVNPNAFEVKEVGGSAEVVDFTPDLQDQDFNVMVKEIVRATDKVSLPEAEIVVSAGRGLKGPENWGMVEELADVLGAATACSKPVSDAGWRPHSEHVGQTGIVVSPNLYIAIGISGAIQHLAGVSSSKTIVVINKDPEAPFFKVADYGIVGDAFDIVPKLTALPRSLRSRAAQCHNPSTPSPSPTGRPGTGACGPRLSFPSSSTSASSASTAPSSSASCSSSCPVGGSSTSAPSTGQRTALAGCSSPSPCYARPHRSLSRPTRRPSSPASWAQTAQSTSPRASS